ncbi:MAG TPA: hypothetical protein VIJ50_05430 [Solirubrobacteraceae bacterium]
MSRSGSPGLPTDDGSSAPGEPDHPGGESEARGPEGRVGGIGGGVVVGLGGPPYRGVAGARYGLFVVVLAAILLIAFTVHVALNSHKGVTSIHPGARIPPFAAPYAVGGPAGEVDVATHADDGSAGKVPACSERGQGILNICELYERGPVVLALFFQAGSCPRVLEGLQRVAPAFPQVSFVAVAVKEGASSVARLLRAKHLTVPVGVDGEGRLGELFAMVSCPQITFVYPGGVVQSAALLSTPSLATLRARVSELVAASRARGWSPGKP